MSLITDSAGRSLVTPALRADDLNLDTAQANAVEFDRALLAAGPNNGTVLLPAGVIAITHLNPRLPMLMLDERHAGITIQGAGPGKTILYDPSTDGSVAATIAITSRVSNYTGAGTAVRGDNFITLTADDGLYQPGDVIYLWSFNSLNTQFRQRTTIKSKSGMVMTLTDTISSTFPADPAFKRVKGVYVNGAANVGDDSVVLTAAGDVSRFALGDDVMITDGPAVNELLSEWVRVTSVHPNGTIGFSPRLRQSYASDRVCLIPPPHLSDLTIRDLAFRPCAGSPGYYGFCKLAVRVTFERVNFVVLSPAALYETAFNFVNCDGLVAGECTFSWVTFGVCHDGVVNNSTALKITGEEFCFDLQFTNVTVDGPVGFFFWTHDTPSGECKRISLTSCRILIYGAGGAVFFPEASTLTDVTIRPAPGSSIANITLNDDELKLVNVVCGTPLRFAGTGIQLVNLTAPSLYFDSTSSGVLATPLLPDPTQVSDGSAGRNWRMPLLTNDLRQVVPPADDNVGLTAMTRSTQTANLVEVRGLSSALFAINKDGDVVSSRIIGSAVSGSPPKKLKVLDASNNAYYLALYEQ